VHLLLSAIEAGQPTVMLRNLSLRIRYLGVLLYDAGPASSRRRSVPEEKNLYQAQLSLFLDPNAREVIEQARKDGVPETWLTAAKASPVYKIGDGLESGAAAAPGIPARCRWCGTCRRCRRSARR